VIGSFNFNSIANISSSEFRSKTNIVILCLHQKGDRDLSSNINFHNRHVIASLCEEQKVGAPISVCYLNIQFLRNKVIPRADYFVFQDIDVLVFPEMWLRTDTDQLTINKLVSTDYKFNYIHHKSGKHKSGKRSGGIGMMYRSVISVWITILMLKLMGLAVYWIPVD